MREFLAQFRDHFLSAAVFSLVINMLMLAPALFMLQVFDRVAGSLARNSTHGVRATQSARTFALASDRAHSALRPPTDFAQASVSR